MRTAANDYSRIERAILFLDENFREQPSLSDISRNANLSEYHFQRLFRRWAGISPKRFLQFLTVEHAKKLLAESKSVLDATYETGLSSPSRLHDLFATVEAVTPGEFKQCGAGLKIAYGFHASPFGDCMLALTERGVCGLSFPSAPERKGALAELKSRWKGARLLEDPQATRPFAERIFAGRGANGTRGLSLFLKGTNFQIRVWEALLRIPPGSVISYEDLATRVGRPNAARAVGNAVGQNPVAYLIPCHRVIRKIGVFGDYLWGTARKRAMLAWESAKTV